MAIHRHNNNIVTHNNTVMNGYNCHNQFCCYDENDYISKVDKDIKEMKTNGLFIRYSLMITMVIIKTKFKNKKLLL